MADKDAPFEEVSKFHGHVCPGLAIGYRMTQEAQAAAKKVESPEPAPETKKPKGKPAARKTMVFFLTPASFFTAAGNIAENT